ncbi:hypothetical protein C0585_01285 [Candidatus Woesearchaeota archaeon]|nr:MAG: hypothetical protein C0585_01285 [Candidatus Woesearchaeota archaeon]
MKCEENLKNISEQTNYVNWIYEIIKPSLKGDILEVGSGVGALTSFIEKEKKVFPIDIRKYDHYHSIKKPIIFDIQDDPSILKRKFDTILCVNVLEHIENDINSLNNMRKLLKKEGNLILFVPAIKKVYGRIDKANLHYRRYNKEDIKKKLKISNFDIEEIKYHNFVGLMGWIYQNNIIKKDLHNVNDLKRFNLLCPLFQKIEKIFPPLLGLSLLVIAKKS